MQLNTRGVYRILPTITMVMICLFYSIGLRAHDHTSLKENALMSDRTTTQVNSDLVIDITGTVTDAEGEPMIGVTIIEKGTTTGAITDIDGTFNIEVADGASVLVFSFVGFVTQEVAVGNQSTLTVILEEEITDLSEVVVVGYGTKQKREITGSISSLDRKSIGAQKVTGFDQAMSGRLSGVQVLQSTGAPGGSVSIRVRGLGTPGVSEPLYVIDGVPVFNSNAGREFISRGQPTNVLNTLNPNDIASIEVLKDAASAAIYGSRAANGVVLITTKKGQVGRPRLTVDYSFGIQSKEKALDVLDGPTWQEFVTELDGARPTLTNPANTDWTEEVFRTAPMQNLAVSASGGNEKSTYMLSLGYLDQEGILRGTDFQRFSLRVNTHQTISKKFRIGNNAAISRTLNSRTAENNVFNAAIPLTAIFPPVIPAFLPDGSLGGPGDAGISFQRTSPLILTDLNLNESEKFRFLGNVFAEYDILDGLTYRLNVGADFLFGGSNSFTPAVGTNGTAPQNTGATRFDSREFIWLVENTLSYKTNIDDVHQIGLLAGVTQQKSTFSSHISSKGEFPNNDLIALDAGNSIGGVGGRLVDWSLASFLARADYSYGGKYFITGTIRRDGSSRFGSGNRWGTFPSISAGWLISDEGFFNSKIFSTLKLRASWGQLGNQEIAPFQYLPLLVTNAQYAFGGNLVPGTYAAQGANEGVTWETSTQTDIGLDMALFDYKVKLSVDYYVKETKDILLQSTLPEAYGYVSDRFSKFPTINAGVVSNKGLEFELGIFGGSTDGLEWGINTNFSTLKNEVLSLGEGGPIIQSQQALSTRTDVGNPIGAFYGYVIEGVFQTQAEIDALNQGDTPYQSPGTVPGDFKFRDLNGDGVVTGADQTFLGSPIPDLIYGIGANLAYKSFDFSVAFQGVQGNDIFASILQQTGDFTKPDNKFTSLYENRWTGQGTSNTVPRVGQTNDNDNYRNSDYFIQDGSYLRLKTLQLGYTLGKSALDKIGMSNLRIYFSGQNLLTFDSYEYGLDPEVGAVNESNTTNGVDLGRYPIPRTLSFGISATF